ncbi:MAG: pyridoxine 5'-phosphate synthase [Candidatus Omnitrophica bacterium]|jgi:pyridoxine 5-phosphate synthase|nr:pyridoxine 5'-phosphate synthase [Candidatus Omnitrophota bacterium]
MTQLGVNIDHIATLRQVRRGIEPVPVCAALLCAKAGADSIVVHLREDRRHIQDTDVRIIKHALKKRLNLEMSVNPGIVDFACEIKPDQATLVPEKRQELTTEGGLEVSSHLRKITSVVKKLQASGIDVSLFIDPDKKQIDAALKTGVKRVELHTGKYANAANKIQLKKRLTEIKNAAEYSRKKGLSVAAGHGLDYRNVKRIAAIKQIEELNIGYSIICRSVTAGIKKAVKEMKALI